MKLKTTSLAALAAFTLAGPASAAVLLTDNFNGVDPASTSNVNYDLAGRQTGTQETQTWGSTGNVQVGNAVFGDTGSGAYMILAQDAGWGTAYASLAGLTLSSSLVAANEKLVISFKADSMGAGNWMSFTLTGGGTSWPVVGINDFGFLLDPSGGMQLFNCGTVTGPGLSTSAGTVDLSFIFSGADGTGSAFAGNGSSVSITDGTSTWSTVITGNLSSEKIAFQNYVDGGRGMIDNLSITTIPEPGAALLGGLGMLALLRRRR